MGRISNVRVPAVYDSFGFYYSSGVFYKSAGIHPDISDGSRYLQLLYPDKGISIREQGGFNIFVTVVNDILFVNDYIETGHMFSLGLFLFLGSQAVLLSRRYSSAFTTNAQLLNELNRVNRQLEDKVLQRTTDLNNKKNALEEQNIKITQQNHELSQ